MSNQWLYDGVMSFENPDFESPDSLFYNNPYGVSVYTDWMADYGAVRSGVSPDIENAGGEVMPRPAFPTLDSGKAVGQVIIDNQWEMSGGDYLTFVKNYVYGNNKSFDDIIPEEQQKLRNYAGHLETYRNHANQKSELQTVVKDIENSVELEFYKESLYEMYPEQKQRIDNAITSGSLSVDDLMYDLDANAPKVPAQLDNDVFTMNNLGIMKDAFDSGVGGMASDLGGMFEWWGMEDIGGSIKDWGDTVQKNNAIDVPEYEFDYEHLGSKEFWMVDAPRALPSMLSLMIPYFGAGRVGQSIYRSIPYAKRFANIEKAYRGTEKGKEALKAMRKGEAISASIAGAVGGRQVESLIEAGGVWNHMKDQGYTDEQAGIAGWEVYKQNQKLLASDVTQLYGIYGRLPFKLSNNFGNWFRATGIGLGVVAEGYEEVLQSYFTELGQAVADDTIEDPELILDIRKLKPEDKKAFAIGVIGGGAFEGMGRLVTNNATDKEIDELLNDIYVKYEDRKEAQANAQEDLDSEFSQFLAEATGLRALKDKLRIRFSNRTLRDVYTAEELISIGYNPADYADARIDENNPRYDKEQGGEQFLLEPEAFNYIDGDGVVNVIFGDNASNEAVLEDVVEAVYRRLEQLDPVLYNNIKAWEQRNQEKSSNFQGRELFSKSFVYNYLGIESKISENNTGSIPLPPDIAESFDNYFVNEDGENIISTLMGVQERRTDRGEQSEILAIPEQTSYEEGSETPMFRVYKTKPTVVIDKVGSQVESGQTVEVGDFVQWTNQGADQFETPRKVLGIERDPTSGRMFAFIEGTNTGIPYDQLEIRSAPASTNDVFITIDNNQGELFKMPEADPNQTEEVQQPVVKREVTIKGIDKLFGEQLTIEDAVKTINEIDKSNSKNIKSIREIPDNLKDVKKEDFNRERILNILSQHPEVAESLAPVVSMSVLREITKDLNIPVQGRKKVDQLIAIQNFFEDAKGKDNASQGSYIGAWLPSETIQEIDIPNVRQNLTNVILDAYKRLLPDGTFVVNLPEGTTPKAREKIYTLLTGTNRKEFKMPKRGMVSINKQSIQKSFSGLFAQANYDKKNSTPTKLIFKGKGQVPPSLVNFMSVDPTLEGKGGIGRGLRRQWNPNTMSWGVDNRVFSSKEYQDYIDRAVETGVTEVVEESQDVFETLGAIKDTDGLKFIDISLGWYTTAVDKSIQVTGSTEIPSLLVKGREGEINRNIFRTLLGLTSPNQAVDNNFNYAVEIYKHIEEKQMRPEFKDASAGFKFFTKTDGQELKMPNSVALNIELFYDLKDLHFDGRMDKTIDWLKTKHLPNDINYVLNSIGRKVKNVDTVDGFFTSEGKVYGAEVFNFKVGAFVANLLGVTDISTIDLWMSRQINRWLGEPYIATNKDVGRMFGDNFFAPNSTVTKMRDEAGARQNFLLFRDVVKGIANDKRITKHFGRKVTPMEVQALLWYMEKALYLNQNARSQKELGESDYGSYSEIRQELRRDPNVNLQTIEGIEPERNQGAYIRGSGKRAFESTYAEDSQGASLGRIDLNQEEDRDGVRPFVGFRDKQSKESKAKQKEYDKNYAPRNWRDYLVTFSTQIGKLHPKLPGLFRRFQFYSLKYYNESMAEVEPLIIGLKDLHKRATKKRATEELKNDYLDIDLGLKNQKYKEIEPLLRKYGLFEAVLKARKQLDKIAKDKEAVGFDSGFLEDYFPRVVTDHLMLKDYLLEYVADQGDKDAIAEEIEARSAEIGRTLELEEQVEVMQRVILGRAQGAQVGTPDNLKERKIKTLNDNANQFYAPTYDALGIYMAQVTEAIAGKRFLGQSKYSVRKQGSNFIVAHKHSGKDATGMKFKNRRDAFNKMKELVKVNLDAQGIPLTGMEYTIDSFILKAMEEYKLDVKQEDRLRKLLQAYFNREKGNPMTMALKTTGYITSMGSIFSAITQIADVGLAVWRSGDRGLTRIPTGAYRTIRALTESLVYSFGQRRFNESFIGREEYGVDAIAEELKPDGGMLLNLLQKVFKVVQLERLDQVGKDTTVNATLAKFRALAKNPNKPEYNDFIYRLQQSFSAEEISQILKDLQDGTRSELVLLLSYTELLKVQPIGKSEVPVGYLEMPNGRIFYQLKTFFLKRFDVYRDEVMYINAQYAEAERTGDKAKMRGLSRQYYARIVGLIALFVLAEMGTDEIKDQLAGRETDLSDKAVQNLLKMVGLSKFTFWTAKREGLDSALLKMIMPPITGIVNDIAIKDVYTLGEKYNKGGMPEVRKHIRESGLRVYNHIPVAGKHLYWWNEDLLGKRPAYLGVGRGNIVSEKYNKDKRKRRKRGRKQRQR